MKIRVSTTQPGGFVEEVECRQYVVESPQVMWVYFNRDEKKMSQMWTHRYGSDVTWVIEELEV